MHERLLPGLDVAALELSGAETLAEPVISVVVPVLDEKENLGPLHSRLARVLDRLGCSSEIVFVDDGSHDGSFDVLRRLHKADERVRVLRFSRNFGQTAAFSAGFAEARGNLIVTMDADLQNAPEDIPLLLAKLREGYDLACGWRVQRRDAVLTRQLPSIVANRLIGRITGVRLHDYGCSLKAYRRDVVKGIRLYGELHRFIPALAPGEIHIAEVPVSHFPRTYGHSKYNLGRTFRVLADILTVRFLQPTGSASASARHVALRLLAKWVRKKHAAALSRPQFVISERLEHGRDVRPASLFYGKAAKASTWSISPNERHNRHSTPSLPRQFTVTEGPQ